MLITFANETMMLNTIIFKIKCWQVDTHSNQHSFFVRICRYIYKRATRLLLMLLLRAKGMMNILVIGSGGREHALAWQCAKDDNVANVYIAPGNAGTALEPKCQNIVLASNDSNAGEHDAVITFCQNNDIDMVIVGPEAPLVTGIIDACRDAGIKIREKGENLYADHYYRFGRRWYAPSH